MWGRNPWFTVKQPDSNKVVEDIRQMLRMKDKYAALCELNQKNKEKDEC